jgi:hypothetical protein
MISGIVTHPGGLLMAKDSQDCHIRVYNGGIEYSQPLKQLASEFVVGALKALKGLGIESFQESS